MAQFLLQIGIQFVGQFRVVSQVAQVSQLDRG